jgi:hypothetical protein
MGAERLAARARAIGAAARAGDLEGLGGLATTLERAHVDTLAARSELG